MAKIPHKYNKFDKMSFSEFAEYVFNTYEYKAYLDDNGIISVYTYFGREVIKSDSKKMIIYWLDFEHKIFTCEKI